LRAEAVRLKRAARGVAKEFVAHDLLTYSSAIAFQILYAVIPLAFLALAALGLFGWQSVYTHHIAPGLEHALSRNAYAIANRTALRAMNGKRLWWTSLGLLVTLWGAGAALRAMMTPLNKIYSAREDRTWVARIGISIGAGAVVILLMCGALLLTLLGPLWNLHGLAALAFWIVRWAATIGCLFAAIAVLLWTVPARTRPIRWISIGTALCTVCWIGATLGFAGMVLLLIYLHVSAIAFLLGVVVDSLLRAEVRKRRRGRA
jgi:membrane protein